MPNEYLLKLSMSQYPYIEKKTTTDQSTPSMSAAPIPGGLLQTNSRATTLHKGKILLPVQDILLQALAGTQSRNGRFMWE